MPGRVRRKIVPEPVLSSSAISPPWARITSRAIASPSPVPPGRAEPSRRPAFDEGELHLSVLPLPQQRGDHPLYMLAFFLLIVFFTYFYVSITFNPEEVADNMKKYGGFIPGIRAGKPTEDYLSYVLSRITLPGALYLGLIALIPLIAFVLIGADQNFPFGGTSILIMVGVALDTVKQIESQLQQRNYEGFLR